ncbi:hypothetical protein FOA52_001383 [Chlamydomonas sp. UWO 241]|nr:hypothetical protein FOA52_001383 [Chlamydomonas sp. UWO 241]
MEEFSIEEVPVDDDSGESDLESPSTSQSDHTPNANRLFIVSNARVAGGHRPSCTFEGELREVCVGVGGVPTLERVGNQDDTTPLVLSLRYEPPSPKFSRADPSLVSYRVKLLQGSQFIYLHRGLPKVCIVDRQARCLSWGQVQLVLRDTAQLNSVLSVLRHTDVQHATVWPPQVSNLWLSRPDFFPQQQQQQSEITPATSGGAAADESAAAAAAPEASAADHGKGQMAAAPRPCCEDAREECMQMFADEDGTTALMATAGTGQVEVMRMVLQYSADPARMMVLTDCTGCTTLMLAAQEGHTDAMRLLLEHPSADAAAMMMHTSDGDEENALMLAARYGHVDAMRLLLGHPSADAAAMMMHTCYNDEENALMLAARSGYADAMLQLLSHPSAAAAMMTQATMDGQTALLMVAASGRVDMMRLFLDHPSVDAAVMLMFADSTGTMNGNTALIVATEKNRVKAMRLLLDHPAQPGDDAQHAHMSEVMEALCQGPLSNAMFDNDTPDDARDECIRLLLARGARMVPARCNSPVMARIIHEYAQLASVPQLINDAVVDMAIERKRPRDDA